MKTCIIKKVYESILRLRGIDPATADVTAAENATIAEYINERAETGWRRYFWQEIMKTEQRQYRATWDGSLTYATDDEVFYEDADGNEKYYVSLQDANVNYNPATETDWWAEVGEDFQRTIDFQQEGENEIDDVDLENCIYDKDPRIYRFAAVVRPVIFFEDGIQVTAEEAPAKPWVRFRPPPPEFSLTEWSDATNYAIADLVYLAGTGECYKALLPSLNKNPESETTYWEPVDFPKYLKAYVVFGAHADYLIADPPARAGYLAEAEKALDELEDELVDGRGEIRKAQFSRQ
ncbi:MAG: hypothetical protein WC551_12545 [Patescibacteria group bacterium]